MKELRKSFWDLVAVTGSTILSIPLMLISESIQARYLGPGNYGKVALIISTISLLYLFGMSWMQRIIMRYGKEEFLQYGHLRKTTGNYLFIITLCVIFVAGLFFTFKSAIFKFLEIKNNYAVWVILAGLLLNVSREFVFEILKVIRLIKLQTFLFRLATKIFILIGFLFLAFIYFGIKVDYVIAVYLISDMVVILIGFSFIKKKYIFPFVLDRKMVKTMLVYAFPLLFSSWSNYVVNWIDAYVIKYYMTLNDVGIYQAAYKITSTLKSFWGASLVTISTPIIMVYKTTGQIEKITKLYLKRLLPQLSFFSMVVLSLIILFAGPLFNFIFGSKFVDSILPFKIITASINFTVITYSLMAVITSFDMTKLMLWIGLITSILNVAADFILVPYLGINGPAIASCFIFSIGPVIWFYYINRQFKFNRKLSLFFPFITFSVMIINIIPMIYLIKILLTLVLIAISFVFGRQFELFHPDDQRMLNNINMPVFYKNLVSKSILLLSKKKST